MKLDKEITDVFSLMSVLLVFVAGYFSAILPVTDELLTRAPEVQADRKGLAARLGAYRKLVGGLVVVVSLVLGLFFPLSIRVLINNHLSTLRAGILLIELLFLIGLIASAMLWRRLTQRIGELSQ